MKRTSLKTLCLILFIASGLAGALSAQKPAVSSEELKKWISFLASDEMRGRANGSPEMKIAAQWISDRYAENGVKVPDGWKDYIQNYTMSSRQQEIAERNVIGIIEGNDPVLKNEYIVLSAHFDHIGIRKSQGTDSIYNGADDNAAGTCTLIGIAKAIRLLNLKPGRSIILAAFSGEERGVRGSRYFVSSNVIPLKNIYADINFEMTGHSELLGKDKYYMTGCKNSNLDDLISEYNKGTGFTLVDTIQLAERLFNASDNISFSRSLLKDGVWYGVPSGTFATSTMASYIHTVSDEAALFDFDNYAALVDYFAGMVIWLSDNKSPVNWTADGFSRPR